MKNSRALIAIIVAVTLVCTLLAGCSSAVTTTQGSGIEQGKSGNLILKVNPELSVSYNKQGKVTKIEGLNDDGDRILDEYDDFVGKDCKVVVNELVNTIKDAGYFIETANGDEKTITISLTKGSVVPNERFLDDIADDVQSSIEATQTRANVVKINEAVQDRSSVGGSTKISKDEALAIAQRHSGTSGATISTHKNELDRDDGRLSYEIEFRIGKVEYEYDIDAKTGEIIKAERDSDNDGIFEDFDDDRDDDFDDKFDDDRDDDFDDKFDDDRDDDFDDKFDDDRDDDFDDKFDDDRDDDRDDYDDYDDYDDDDNDDYDDNDNDD